MAEHLEPFITETTININKIVTIFYSEMGPKFGLTQNCAECKGGPQFLIVWQGTSYRVVVPYFGLLDM